MEPNEREKAIATEIMDGYELEHCVADEIAQALAAYRAELLKDAVPMSTVREQLSKFDRNEKQCAHDGGYREAATFQFCADSLRMMMFGVAALKGGEE